MADKSKNLGFLILDMMTSNENKRREVHFFYRLSVCLM